MGIAVLLAIVFSGTQSEPFGFTGEAPIVTAFPVAGTTYVAGTPHPRAGTSESDLTALVRDVGLLEYRVHVHRPDNPPVRTACLALIIKRNIHGVPLICSSSPKWRIQGISPRVSV